MTKTVETRNCRVRMQKQATITSKAYIYGNILCFCNLRFCGVVDGRLIPRDIVGRSLGTLREKHGRQD
jgi:hypothetical protein